MAISHSRPSWTDCLKLARGSNGRELVEALLGELAHGLEAPAAAVYFEEDGWLARQTVVGEASSLPGRLTAAEAAAAGHECLELAGARVLLAPGSRSPEEAASELLTALAAAIRAWLLEKRLKQKRFEVNYRGVELEALYDVGLAIASTLNLDELSEEILLRAVSLLDARRGALWGVDDDRYVLARAIGGTARRELELDDPLAVRLLDAAAASDQAPGDQDLLPGAQHLLGVPIEVDGAPKGLLFVADKESRTGVGPFSAEDRRTLKLLANQAAIALENAHLHRQALEKERLEREAELAAEIQRRLLPATLPEFPGLELEGWSRSAREVGGDYYDLLRLPGGRLAAVVADVSGKGMPAALLVSTLYSALRLLVEKSPVEPELVERLNRHIFESSTPNKFITLLAADVDPVSGEVAFVNAGHNPAIHLGREGGVRELASGGLPLGLFHGGSYARGSLVMAPGDLLCFFSDGITEAASPDDEEFGDGRLVDLLRENRERPLAEIVQVVERATATFAHGLPQGDDQTLVLLRKT